MHPHSLTRRHAAFSLVELLTVIAIAAILMGAAIPVISSINKGTDISTASRLLCNTMTVARSQAINRQTLTRFAVVKNWTGRPEANFRNFAIFQAEVTTGTNLVWKQVSNWETLPANTVIDQTTPDYVKENDPNGYAASGSLNTFTVPGPTGNIELYYIEYLPTGASRLPDATVPDVWLTIRAGSSLNPTAVTTPSPANWSTVATSTLTGRLSVLRP
jgi:prepilin-type N-terminal cleavage/methylation domain-containing protein